MNSYRKSYSNCSIWDLYNCSSSYHLDCIPQHWSVVRTTLCHLGASPSPVRWLLRVGRKVNLCEIALMSFVGCGIAPMSMVGCGITSHELGLLWNCSHELRWVWRRVPGKLRLRWLSLVSSDYTSGSLVNSDYTGCKPTCLIWASHDIGLWSGCCVI